MGAVSHSTPSLSLRVPAKLNPQIRAGPLRQDGYHDITLVYQAISLYDVLTISHDSSGPAIRVTGMDSGRVPSDSRNLVVKAAILLGNHANIEPRLHFDLVKSIPSEAGLGGGSADAAAALVGCRLWWKLDLTDDDLMALGAQLGEDVPFFVHGMMAIGLGHKQPLIKLAPSGHKWHWVLGIPFRGLATKDVFQMYDRVSAGSVSQEKDYLLRQKGCLDTPWESGSPQELLPALVNDLELPSTRLLPDIATALQAGRSAGALASIMTGSGSTCAFLAENESHAACLMEQLQRENIFIRVVVAFGPVEGVSVLESH